MTRVRIDSATVSEFRYNGLGHRITMKHDADGDASIEAEEEYHFVYDTGWRAVMTRRYTDTAASIPAYKDRTIYHNAGLGGYGGSGYTDAVLMRDADLTNAWSGAADGTAGFAPTRRVGWNKGDRQYYSNNWRGDVVAILDDAGRVIEQVRYTPYGVPFALPAGDSDSDGDWDGTDVTNIGGTYDIREDSDLDGDTDLDDFTHSNNRAGGGALYLGWKFLSSAYCANRKGYASYEHDAAAPATLAHVRYRVYNFTLGRWTQRDPAGYVDGPNLYGYVGARAIVGNDPRGLAALIGAGGGGCTESGLGCGGGGCEECEQAKNEVWFNGDYQQMKDWIEGQGCATPTITCEPAPNPGSKVGGTTFCPCSAPNCTITIYCTPGRTKDTYYTTIMHEYVHAFDNCALCKSKHPQHDCVFKICTEARAYAYNEPECKNLPPDKRVDCIIRHMKLSICPSDDDGVSSTLCCTLIDNPKVRPLIELCIKSPLLKPPFLTDPPYVDPPAPPNPPAPPTGDPSLPGY